MKTRSEKQREATIAFDMNYCQHYYSRGLDKKCEAGQDIKNIQCVPVGLRGMKWGPCIEGHALENPQSYCACWVRRTREMGEARADGIEKMMQKMALVDPVVSEWRKKPWGKAEIIECPACKGRLHLSQASSNGHVHGKCMTEGCVSWME